MLPTHSIPKNVLAQIDKDGLIRVAIGKELQSILQTTVNAGFKFFRLGSEDKLLNSYGKDMGYRALRQQYSQSPDRPDQVESFTVSVRHKKLIEKSMNHNAVELYEQAFRSIDVLEPIAEEITTQLAGAIAGHERARTFEGAFRPWSLLQLNYSRPSEIAGEVVNDLHEDGCLITIASASGPGLEIHDADQLFLPITPERDQLLALPGEIMSLLSGGRIRPLYHRVMADSRCKERLSILFFGDVDPKRCEPWVVNDFNRDVDIGDRVLKNSTRFGLAEWTADASD
jgi:isopenicillin N synthase-like dioxygenase